MDENETFDNEETFESEAFESFDDISTDWMDTDNDTSNDDTNDINDVADTDESDTNADSDAPSFNTFESMSDEPIGFIEDTGTAWFNIGGDDDSDDGGDWWSSDEFGSDIPDTGGYTDPEGNEMTEDEWNEAGYGTSMAETEDSFGQPVAEGEVDAAVAAQGASAAASTATQKADDAKQDYAKAREDQIAAKDKADEAFQKALDAQQELNKALDVADIMDKAKNGEPVSKDEQAKVNDYISSHGIKSGVSSSDIRNAAIAKAEDAQHGYAKAVEDQKAANDKAANAANNLNKAEEERDEAVSKAQEAMAKTDALAAEAKAMADQEKAAKEAAKQDGTKQDTSLPIGTNGTISDPTRDNMVAQLAANIEKAGGKLDTPTREWLNTLDKASLNFLLHTAVGKNGVNAVQGFKGASELAKAGHPFQAIWAGVKATGSSVKAVMSALNPVSNIMQMGFGQLAQDIKDAVKYGVPLGSRLRESGYDEAEINAIESLYEEYADEINAMIAEPTTSKQTYDYMKDTGATNVEEYNRGLTEDINKVVSDSAKKVIKHSPYVMIAVEKWRK